MVQHVFVNLADGRPLFDESEYADRQHFLVAEGGIAVARLPLGHCGEAAPVALADEQVDPNKRRGSVHVANGSLSRRCWFHLLLSRLRRLGFFNP